MVSSLVRQGFDVSKHARVVIVECKPENTYHWQMEFEKHLEDYPDWALEKWYRPKNWDDMKKAINDDYDLPLVVSKLVFDPYKNIPLNFIEAVIYMMTREEGDGDKVVIFDKWNESQYLSSSLDKNSKKSIYCEDGMHVIFQGVDYEVKCTACHKQVTIGDEASYACKMCTIVLHKDCAESFDNNKTVETNVFGVQYEFPKKFPCAPCKEDGQGFSEDCAFCLFEAHIRSRLRPTVLEDLNVDKHFLSIVLTPVVMIHEFYVCKACGELDIFGMYMCRICSVACHYTCLTMPRRVKQEHGGHYHIMSLMFSSKPDQEDYMCDECLEKRNPEAWYYSCEECVFVVHLNCVYKTSYLDDDVV